MQTHSPVQVPTAAPLQALGENVVSNGCFELPSADNLNYYTVYLTPVP
jgi:hypothetical protein